MAILNTSGEGDDDDVSLLDKALRECPHFEMLDEILGTKEADNPAATLEGDEGLRIHRPDINSDDDNDDNIDPSLRSPKLQSPPSSAQRQQETPLPAANNDNDINNNAPNSSLAVPPERTRI